jgi:phosphoglycerate kinase
VARAAAGDLLASELRHLRVVIEPERPLLCLLGGAKVSDKLALVESLLGRVEHLLVGGGMAFTFLRAQGHEVGRSLLEAGLVETAKRLLETAAARGVMLGLPVDTVVAKSPDAPAGQVVPLGGIPAEAMGLDIGPATVAAFGDVIRRSRTVVWNGPMGVFEQAPFAAGTLGVARAVADSGALSIVGGGDTVAAVEQAGVADRIGYLSTGGGAFLEYLEGRTLPGVAALDDRA